MFLADRFVADRFVADRFVADMLCGGAFVGQNRGVERLTLVAWARCASPVRHGPNLSYY
jgi:hypothetical protein